MISLFIVVRRFVRALRYAAKQQAFRALLAAALTLLAVGTIFYTLNEHWRVIDSLYFSVCTLTTLGSPGNLYVKSDLSKIFTIFFVLLGIGLILEFARELGLGLVAQSGDRIESLREKRHARTERRES